LTESCFCSTLFLIPACASSVGGDFVCILDFPKGTTENNMQKYKFVT